MTDLFRDQARARSSDPSTSHEAAAAIDPHITDHQRKVEAWAIEAGPGGFTDLELSVGLGDDGSTARTRRGELTARNIIIWSGHRRSTGESPRMRLVWVHRSFVEVPPPIVDPPAVTDATRAIEVERREVADALTKLAEGFRKQGRAWAAQLIERGAELLKAS